MARKQQTRSHERPKAQTISDEQIIEVIEEIAESGISLKKACENKGLVYRTVLNRIRSTEELSAFDAKSRQDYMRARVRELNEIALNEPDVSRARLLCDNIKWEAARICRNEYGDKVINEHQGGDPDKPILQKIEVSFVKP
jgi:hypothetical protein